MYYLCSHCPDQDVEYFFSPGHSIVLLYCTRHHRLFYLSQKFIEVASYSLLQFCVWPFLLRIMSTILIHVISSCVLFVVFHYLNIPQFSYPSSLDRHSSYFHLLGRKLLWPTLYRSSAIFVHFSHIPSTETPGS